MKIIAVCSLLIVVAYAKIPNYVTICQNGANLSQCLMDNFNKVKQHLTGNGEPAFGLDDLRAVEIEGLNLTQGNYVIALHRPKFYGLENMQLDEFIMTDKQIHMKGTIPVLQCYGDYVMNGRVLTMPINREGVANVTFVDCEFDYTCRLKIKERRGKKYYYVNNDWNDLTFKLLPKKSHFFDPGLGSEMNAFLNENSEDVYQDIRAPVERGFVFSLLHKYINGYLRHIPIENLFKT